MRGAGPGAPIQDVEGEEEKSIDHEKYPSFHNGVLDQDEQEMRDEIIGK